MVEHQTKEIEQMESYDKLQLRIKNITNQMQNITKVQFDNNMGNVKHLNVLDKLKLIEGL